MFPNPIIAYEVTMMDQRELVEAATERSRHLTTAAPAQGTLSIAGTVRQFLSTALGRIAMLLPDSRDGLRTKEQELAAVGVAWPPDLVRDEMLARQIETARARRQLGYPVADGVPVPGTSGPLPKGMFAPQPNVVPSQA